MTPNTLDLKLLLVLVDVVEAGSFTAAARLRNTDVGYISRQIKKLETDLGSVLFNRSTRSLSLTHLGNQTYQHATHIRDISQQIVETAQREQQDIQGLVRVTCGAFLGRQHVFHVLEALSNQIPGLRLELELDEDKVDIIKRRFDLAIRVWKPRDSNLIAQKICSFRFLLAATPGFIAEHGEPQSLTDLEALPAILYARNEHSNKQFAYLDRQGIIRSHPLHSNLLVSDAELIINTVLSGKRYGLFPDFMVKDALASGQLVPLLPDIQLLSDEGIYLVYPTKSKTRAVERVMTALKQHFAAHFA